MTALKTYVWQGTACHESLISGEGAEQTVLDLALVPGREVEAPPEHPLVTQWVAAGLLTEPAPVAAEKAKSNTKALPAPATEQE